MEKKDNKNSSVADYVFESLLRKIQTGEWPVGFTVPSERTLIEDLGVSRIALREAILRLRTLGVLRVAQGKRSTVARMDSSILARLFPLMLTLERERTVKDIFQVRLTLESDTAMLAAENRTEEDLERLWGIVATLHSMSLEEREPWVKQEVTLHKEIARATHNPMYAVLIDALSHFMNHVQLTLHDHFARNNTLIPNRKMTLIFHDSLMEAIRDRDPQYARVLMQSHLRADAKNVTTSGLLASGPRSSDLIRSNSAGPSDLLTMVLEQYSG